MLQEPGSGIEGRRRPDEAIGTGRDFNKPGSKSVLLGRQQLLSSASLYPVGIYGQYFQFFPFSKRSQKSKFLCKIFWVCVYVLNKTFEVIRMLIKLINIYGSYVASGVGIALSKSPWRCSRL